MRSQLAILEQTIEGIIVRKVTNILASKALDQSSHTPQSGISKAIQRRLKLLDQKIDSNENGRE